jgi:hypothetical protein
MQRPKHASYRPSTEFLSILKSSDSGLLIIAAYPPQRIKNPGFSFFAGMAKLEAGC